MADIPKIYYFGIRGRGEFLRMILTAANQKFEDNRIEMEQWGSDPEIKKGTPYGQLPYVIYKGKKYGQSIPLASYFAKKFGFYGKTDEDPEKKKEKVQQLTTELFPKYFRFFEAILAENGDKGLFVGTSVTLADMYVFDFLETCLGIDPQALKNFPLLTKLRQNVQTMPALKTYLANRPKTVI